MRMQPTDVVYLENDYERAAAKLDFADPKHVLKFIRKSALVMTPEFGFAALFLKGCIDLTRCKDAYSACVTVDDLIDKRPAAVGSQALPRIKKDGRRGSYHVTPDAVIDLLERDNVRQAVLGLVSGKSGRGPHLTELTRDRTELLNRLRTLIEEVNQLFEAYFPTLYDIQRAEVKQASQFELGLGAFTSAYIHKNLRSGYHLDSSNLPGSMSALIPLGKFTGGELVLPRWGIGFALEPGDLLLFDSARHRHGNLPFHGERACVVLYLARGVLEVGKQRDD